MDSQEDQELDDLIESTLKVRQINNIVYCLRAQLDVLPIYDTHEKWDSIRQLNSSGEAKLVDVAAIVMTMFGMFEDVEEGGQYAKIAVEIDWYYKSIWETAEHLYNYINEVPCKMLKI